MTKKVLQKFRKCYILPMQRLGGNPTDMKYCKGIDTAINIKQMFQILAKAVRLKDIITHNHTPWIVAYKSFLNPIKATNAKNEI